MTDSIRPSDEKRAPLIGNWLSDIDDRIARTDGLLCCLDFDGTLAEIAADPEAVELLPACRDAIHDLDERSDTTVAVISGRALSDVRERVGIEGLWYAGNHGLEIYHDGETVVHPVAEKRRSTVQTVCSEVADRLADEPGCWIEEKGVTATVHYRNAADDRGDHVEAVVRSTVQSVGDGLVLTDAKEAVEVRPSIDWGKGDAVEVFRERIGEGYLPMYVGDDATDESAFDAVDDDGIGVHVGDGRGTAATYRVPDPTGVGTFLEWLADRD
jgi:trehalose 6-phosphate phosphatase